jgi:putative flippase GtrA
MVPEAPFFTAVATVSMTLAGFSGLLIALRHGDQLRRVDMFHLRGIVETGLGTALIALLTIAVATLVGDLRTATPVLAAVVIAFIGFQITVFAVRQRRTSVRVGRLQSVGAVVIDVATVVLAVVTIFIRAAGAYEVLLLLLLARPMWDFVGVLREMGGPDVPGSANRGE